MEQKYVILHISSGREYMFSPDFWTATDAKQKANGVIEWQFVRIETTKQAAPAPPTTRAAVAKKPCNCAGRNK